MHDAFALGFKQHVSCRYARGLCCMNVSARQVRVSLFGFEHGKWPYVVGLCPGGPCPLVNLCQGQTPSSGQQIT